MKQPLLKVKNLIKVFPGKKKKLLALGGLSFSVDEGKTLGLVGESGSGKSTAAMAICALEKPTSGTIELEGENLLDASKKRLKQLRKKIQIVFQDPSSSLNPRFSALQTVMEAFAIHNLCNRKQAAILSKELLLRLGIAEEHLEKFPHELSGGQRQRISLARALAVSPKLLVLDEPLSSLDVSVQAQIVELFKELQEKQHLSYLFISHDLTMVRYFCHSVAVIYEGFLMEEAPTNELFEKAKHPYTQLLLSSIPLADPIQERARSLPVIKDSSCEKSAGCVFAPRCPKAQKKCWEQKPEIENISEDHLIACHFWNQ